MQTEAKPDIIFTTVSGSIYVVDQQKKTIQDGKYLPTPIRYFNDPVFKVGKSAYFDLENGKYIETSDVFSVREVTPQSRNNENDTTVSNESIERD